MNDLEKNKIIINEYKDKYQEILILQEELRIKIKNLNNSLKEIKILSLNEVNSKLIELGFKSSINNEYSLTIKEFKKEDLKNLEDYFPYMAQFEENEILYLIMSGIGHLTID